jgi:hypothetical protein
VTQRMKTNQSRRMAKRTSRELPSPVSYWLIVQCQNNMIDPLTLHTNGERETLPVFSSEEEAEIFLRFGGVTALRSLFSIAFSYPILKMTNALKKQVGRRSRPLRTFASTLGLYRKRLPLIVEMAVALFLVVALIGGYAFRWQSTGFPDATVWDWLRLAFVSISIAVAAYLFNLSLSKRTEFIEDQREQQEGLEAFIDKLIDLSVEKDLRNREDLSDIRLLTRARTLALLWRLDANRKKAFCSSCTRQT